MWTVRAANTGVSAAIDASGRVREGTPIFEHAVLVADVPKQSALQVEAPVAGFAGESVAVRSLQHGEDIIRVGQPLEAPAAWGATCARLLSGNLGRRHFGSEVILGLPWGRRGANGRGRSGRVGGGPTAGGGRRRR